MEKVILFGPFGFLGYSLCKALLEEGIQVNGISFEHSKKNPFTDDKRMEIGRNANFFEDENEERTIEENNHQTMTPVIVPFYDMFYIEEEIRFLKDEKFCKLIRHLNPEYYPLTLLLPIQLAGRKHLKDGIIEPLIDSLKDKGFLYKEIYLPTLYGPWQPEEYVFQQLLFSHPEEKKLSIFNMRESVSDSVYIEDAAKTVLDLLPRSGGKYVVHSGIRNSWFKCAEDLIKSKEDSVWKQQIEQLKTDAIPNERLRMNGQLEPILVKNPMNPANGLEQQRRQYEYWLQSR